MEIATERLLLREFLPADAAALFAYQSAPAYLEHYAGDAAPTAEGARALVDLFRRWAAETPRARFQLAITLEGRLIGTCGVRGEAPGDPSAEFGCELDASFQRRGYALEASRAIVAFGLETLRLRRIIARTTPGNLRATSGVPRASESQGAACGRDREPTRGERLAQALGFVRIGEGAYERGDDSPTCRSSTA